MIDDLNTSGSGLPQNDRRARKPHLHRSNATNETIVTQDIEIYVTDKATFAFVTPNTVALFLSTAEKSLKRARSLRRVVDDILAEEVIRRSPAWRCKIVGGVLEAECNALFLAASRRGIG